ncbi:protein ced-11-like protein [Dinothrombium tinctorium]|uniref:Protein ced-11-like protein n=1 Tax=Dinothrombium tinctorium TaxID=1965070 RepID=A0A3S3RIQ5_9ACAR|nr:protein ced-11-like protein [Dinothrombium tinctorium]RWS01524.1 protein ced-11-like protein [Dinothrombium tinctorium]RWS03928.1 protein ced-11-like protein [Dinothrombium tinctorium]RWS03935.1 protein ced-11-like protein [Dinothrombium tinctorium]
MDLFSSSDLDTIRNASDMGPIEIEEPFNIIWNANDWPLYIRCPFSTEIQNLARIIQEGWRLKKPHIMLSIISQFNSLQWQNESQISHFKQGLIKAASAAKMWIITNGIDVGISNVIAEAIENQKKWITAMKKTSPLLEATCIGVVREDRITTDPLMQRNLKDIEKLNETNPLNQARDRYKEGKFYIDSFHTHFIFVMKEEDTDLEQLLTLDLFSEFSFEAAWISTKTFESLDRRALIQKLESSKIPLIAVLVQGDADSANVVLHYLQKQLPVVVLYGSGGFADLLATAYLEIENKTNQEGLWDPDFVEDNLKPMLARKIVRMFPNLCNKMYEVRTLRDKVVECVRNATHEGVEYLTVLDLNSTRVDIRNLDQYLLEAYFKSRQIFENAWINTTPQEILTTDLHLTLEWNNPVIARNLLKKRIVTERVSIAKELFLRALIESGREEFVDIFLHAGFHVRQLYNYSILKWLILQAMKIEFFQVTCCEGFLGLSLTSAFPFDDFLSYTNRLIFLTAGLGNFLKHDDLTNRYKAKPNCVEQKAIAFITIWAVLINNLNLVNKLWPHHNEPINLCLIVSTMQRKMSKFVKDLNLEKKMTEKANEFGQLATQLLDEFHKSSPMRATEALTLQSPHWSYQTASDIAVAGEIHMFIAHQSCQKWLSNKFLNMMHVKQSPFGEFLIPIGLKIILCAFFVFPIKIWFDFPYHVAVERKRLKDKYKQQIISTSEENLYLFMKLDSKIPSVRQLARRGTKMKPKWIESQRRTQFKKYINSYKLSDISFWKKFLIFWSAPITKYWLHQMFYILFLVHFSIAVIINACGNWYLDTSLFAWIILILASDIRRTYLLLKKYVSISATFKYIEIPLVTMFLCFFYLGRIINFEPISKHQYLVRMLMCCALFHYYVRYLAIFIPISSTFGPLFYRLKLMTFKDYIQFILLSMPIMIGGAFVIRVAHFPDAAFTEGDTLQFIFHETFYTFFKVFDTNLFEKEECKKRKVSREDEEENFCKHTSSYIDPKCNTFGFWSYLFNIAFLILMRQVLANLMFAIFNNSLATLDALTIWRYQRFHSVAEFNLRMPLPPPLNIFSYIYYLIKYCCICCRKFRKDKTKNDNLSICHGCPDPNSAYFAKVICNNVVNKRKEVEQFQTVLSTLQNQSEVMTDHFEYVKMQMLKLKRSVTNLKKQIYQLKTDIEKSKKHERKKEEAHLLSRMSPYPNTQTNRLPVPDKYVPWDISWLDYCPPVHSLPKDAFAQSVNADEETIILSISRTAPPMIKPEFKFNALFTYNDKVYDRKSWITDNNNQSLIYQLDGIFPLNPCGRTGLAGRGSLPRWGPNHYIFVFITKYNNIAASFEFLSAKKQTSDCSDYSLIGGFVAGDNAFAVVQQQLDPKNKSKQWKSARNMIEFLANKVEANIFKSEGVKTRTSSVPEKCVQHHLAFKGYMDSPYNTDNAWKEVEFWHFHFTDNETVIDNENKNELSWISLKENVYDKMPIDESNILHLCTKNWKKVGLHF